MKGFKSILISSFLLSGCVTGSFTPEWTLPQKPKVEHVHFEKMNDGLYLNKTNSLNLLNNINNEDAYVEKLEVLISEMKKYYGAK